jgi:hypothetical protein
MMQVRVNLFCTPYLTSDLGDEFRRITITAFQKKGDGTFSFDEDALVFREGKYMLYPH